MMMAMGSNCGSVYTSKACNALLKELQQIWTEIGESEADKDRMLVELEQECLDIYRRKVDEAANAKALLHQSIAAREAEVAMLMATLGEINVTFPVLADKKAKSLKGQLASVSPLVEELTRKKDERMKQFADIKSQIDKITSEISGYGHIVSSVSALNLEEHDLSLRKLMEYQSNLRTLQKEKSERLQKVLDCVNEVHTLSTVLGLDFAKTVNDVHPSLHASSAEHVTNISDSTLEGLDQAILKLKTQRKFRFQKLKDVAGSLFDLWNLMDTPKEDRSYFARITSVLGFSESEIVQPGALSMEIIDQVSAEVERLTKLKATRLKELVLMKRAELEYVCSKIHIQADPSTDADKTNALVDSGLVDPSELLANIEAQISKAKEEALARKELLDKISRWLYACDEEKWLEDYNKDDNRYSAGRGAHINLKRAERARITVNKIPAMVDNLISKTLMWEDEKKMLFLYDGVRLVSILEDYKQARRRKEEEKKQARDQKKLHDMLLAEKESIYGSKPSPRRSSSFRNVNGHRGYGNGNGSVTPSPRRNSSGGINSELLTPRSYSGHQNGYFKETRRLSTAPLNFVAIPKEDTISFSSVCGSEPESPPQR
ncbi:65-kDa microtubule-associated protein 6-like [Andrographis paniculata]|uniref:65-kDa microtubule-associated protein 6-like n=1 Tax=Andrographis paniculata TaxID=175694 RepID=UPI0021E83C36|nr:65-kDa microtubule-associated protein 6-like [Andrographis paniculata]XP_051121487.1 65-kDa microtubule-associated protein 6-like [Andrographis paniculata]XP_051121488.1 65-kDa microtubule-associated protein 6-like [Andrographis paniculata]XP_051121490.1 65-kDa microtubule-associated protein 6-like [Andrographis paniculata]XP_051121491.1 65-kDa microtubule-associated protein 6-like [Andrographis paniculata]XP_051121492.1 65-kDa microtubule-associated protein 6-like [Andrographis paniculata]